MIGIRGERMSRFSWILLILLAILAVSQLWMMDNREAPS